jgi:hypothetical protein
MVLKRTATSAKVVRDGNLDRSGLHAEAQRAQSSGWRRGRRFVCAGNERSFFSAFSAPLCEKINPSKCIVRKKAY